MDDVDLFNLKVSNFHTGYFKDLNICYIEGNRQKADIRFQTFFNSEACNMLKIYLKEMPFFERGKNYFEFEGLLKAAEFVVE